MRTLVGGLGRCLYIVFIPVTVFLPIVHFNMMHITQLVNLLKQFTQIYTVLDRGDDKYPASSES